MLTDNEALVEQRHNLSHHEQVDDAQSQCVPCKLCGGKAVITDAGTGAGYYIACENGSTFKASKGCLLDSRRLGGWAYNVMDWWNRLHGTTDAARIAALEEGCRALIAWDDAEKAGPDYGTLTRDTHPEGEIIWREWWNRQQRLCQHAFDSASAAIAAMQPKGE